MIDILTAFPQNLAEANPLIVQPGWVYTAAGSSLGDGLGALVPVCSPSTTPLMNRLVPVWVGPLLALPGVDMVHSRAVLSSQCTNTQTDALTQRYCHSLLCAPTCNIRHFYCAVLSRLRRSVGFMHCATWCQHGPKCEVVNTVVG